MPVVSDVAAVGRDAWRRAVAVLGKPGHCEYVDKAAQALVKRALRKQGVSPSGPVRKLAGSEARRLCTTLTPEGRTLIIIAAATGVTVYAVMNYEEVEAAILEAAKRAKIPLKLPMPKGFGELTAKVGFDAARAEWELKSRSGTQLQVFFEQPYRKDAPSVGVGVSHRFGAGRIDVSGSIDAEKKRAVAFQLKLVF